MKKVWKKICIIILGLLFFLIPITALGTSGSISVSGPGQVVAGNQITVTVTLSSAVKIGSWSMQLNYDSSMLQLNSTTSESGGVRMANSSAGGTTAVSYSFTFTALKSGSTSVSVGSYEAYNFDDFSEIGLSSGAKSISIVTQEQVQQEQKREKEEQEKIEAAKSKNNNLKNLEVEDYEISPEFKTDTLEYTVTVQEGTKKINIIATRDDDKAQVYGAGEQEVSEEKNEFEIIVVAENGSEKSYKLTVVFEDKDPINVKVDGKKYTVVKLDSLLTKPEKFKKTTVKIKDKEIPAFYNKKLDMTLVGLKNEKGKIALFEYKNGKYKSFAELKINNMIVIANEIDTNIKGYKKYIANIQGKEVEVLSKSKDNRYKIINGINLNTYEKGYFLYDSKDDNIIKYDIKSLNKILKQNELLMYASAIFGGIALISLISLLVVSSKKNKNVKPTIDNSLIEEKDENIIKEEKPKKNKKAKKEDQTVDLEEAPKEEKPKKSKKKKNDNIEEEPKEDVNEIFEKEETEVYDIFEDEHKKKRKKKAKK